MEIDNMIIHYKPQFKFLPVECNLKSGKKIIARGAWKDTETLYKWLREANLDDLPHKVIKHK